MLDYLAKTAFKQSQLLQEMKDEIQNLADGQKGLQSQLEKMQEKGDINIDQYKVNI